MQPIQSSNLYIIHKTALSHIPQVQERILMLDRVASQLVVYKKVDNENLHNYYSIRNDFDSSDHFMYEVEMRMDCLFGGEESPTPAGIFCIQDKSDNCYVSGYRKGYDEVKFFGYLVIFEDYFIHSEMYEAEVTTNQMRSGEAECISKEDRCTAGCIRIAQENIDWLVKEIQVGTTIIM